MSKNVFAKVKEILVSKMVTEKILRGPNPPLGGSFSPKNGGPALSPPGPLEEPTTPGAGAPNMVAEVGHEVTKNIFESENEEIDHNQKKI